MENLKHQIDELENEIRALKYILKVDLTRRSPYRPEDKKRALEQLKELEPKLKQLIIRYSQELEDEREESVKQYLMAMKHLADQELGLGSELTSIDQRLLENNRLRKYVGDIIRGKYGGRGMI